MKTNRKTDGVNLSRAKRWLVFQAAALAGGVLAVHLSGGNAWAATGVLVCFGLVTYRVAGVVMTMHVSEQVRMVRESARAKGRETVVGSV